MVETKPTSEVTALNSEIKPTKPVAKTTKQLSSVVRVVSANVPASSSPPSASSVNDNNPQKPGSSKVQIVSSHVEAIDESKKSAPKSVVHVEAIEDAAIAPSRVEVVGISSPESYVEYLWYLILGDTGMVYFNQSFSLVTQNEEPIQIICFDCISFSFRSNHLL